MFRDATHRQTQLKESATDALEAWRAASNWFDGSIESIDRRVAACSALTHRLGSAGIFAAMDEIAAERAAAVNLRQGLLNGHERVAAAAPTRSDAPMTVEARAFVREHLDVAHAPEELTYRARRHAANLTYDQPAARADAIADAFVASVTRVAATVPRQATAAAVTSVPDFDDSLMFM